MHRATALILCGCMLSGCSLLGRFAGEAPPRDVREVAMTLDVERPGALPATARWSSVDLRSVGGDLAPVAARELRARLASTSQGPPLVLVLVVERADRRAPARPGGPPYYAFALRLEVTQGETTAELRTEGTTRADPAGLMKRLARQLADHVRARTRPVTIALLEDGSAPVTSAIERARAGQLTSARQLLTVASRAAIHHTDVPRYDLAALAEAMGDLEAARAGYLEAWERSPDAPSRARCLAALERVRRLPVTRVSR